MSRLRGDEVTDTDRRLYDRYYWRYIKDDPLIPARIMKRLRLAYVESFRNAATVFNSSAIPARALSPSRCHTQNRKTE